MPPALPTLLARTLAGSLRTLRRRYRKRLERCQRKFSEAAVHELRIETRRLLAMLDLLRALQFSRALRRPRKVLKRRLDAFDALRDTHVCLALLKPLRREVPEARVLDPLWRRQEQQWIAKLRHEIKATKQSRLQKRLKRLETSLRDSATAAPRRTAETLVLAALREAFANVVALRRRVRRQSPATIHRLRVAFKRIRYKCELLRSLLPGFTKKHLQRMRAFQARMGDIQDMEVLLAAVTVAAERRHLPPSVARGLRKTLLARRRDAIDRFLASVDELSTFDPTRFAKSEASAKTSSP